MNCISPCFENIITFSAQSNRKTHIVLCLFIPIFLWHLTYSIFTWNLWTLNPLGTTHLLAYQPNKYHSSIIQTDITDQLQGKSSAIKFYKWVTAYSEVKYGSMSVMSSLYRSRSYLATSLFTKMLLFIFVPLCNF